MAKREVELGTGALTVTDHGTLHATRQVYRLAQKSKLRPILGVEAYFRDDECDTLRKYGIVKAKASEAKDAKETVAHYMKYAHVTMHSLDQESFETMVRVMSRAAEHPEYHGSARAPILTWQDLEELGGQNMTFGSSCLAGMVERHLLSNRPDIAIAYYERLRSLVKPGNFYVELFPHDCSRFWVKGIALKFDPTADGICEDDKRFHFGKWLRIRHQGGVEEIRASDLADMWQKWLDGKGSMPKVELLAVKNYQVWADEVSPVPLRSVDRIEDFVQNECQPWCPDGDLQRGANKFLLGLAKRYGDPVLVSDDSHFAYPDEKDVQDVRLFSMESEKTKGNTARWRFYGSYHRKTSQEAFEHFQKTLGVGEDRFRGWVDNNIAWSQRFGWEFKDRKQLPTKFYPSDTLNHTMGLIKRVGRMDWSDATKRERLAAELKMLHRNGVIDLLPYFFIDQEVCQLYEDAGQLAGPGRGSAAGLLLTYCLGITHVDPLRYGLSKERFLTESRIRSGKLPDIDQDLPSQDLLVDPADPRKGWLQERFPGHIARVSTNTQLRLRNSMQDVARVRYGQVPPEVLQLTKKLPKVPQGIKDKDFVFGYKDADKNDIKGIIETDPALKQYVREYPDDWALVVKALGLTRQKSQHACAFVMTNEPVSNFIPTFALPDGTRLTEYVNSAEDPSIEEAGGVKMDFLRVNSLQDIQVAVQLVQQRMGYQPKDERIGGVRVPGIRVVPFQHNDGRLELFDVWDLPEDQAVFRDMCFGETETVFQFGTSGAKRLLKNFVVNGQHTLRSVEHISAFTALDRPGPLDAHVEEGETKRNMLEEFAARSKGEKAIGNNPVLDKLLPESYGVITYQEQLQKVFVEVGQTSAEAGDEFRIHVSKKKMALVLKDKAIFMPGAIKTLGEAEANRVWAMLETFGQYGFNKSHSVCYALIGYVCAWLKHHHPLEWWTGVLRNADRKKIDKFWGHCGPLVLMPDVKLSRDDFAIEGNSIRAPLRLLSGVGEKAHEELVGERPFQDIRDFCQKIYDRRVRTGSVSEKEKRKKIPKKQQVAGGPTETVEKVQVLKLGRSNLNATILTKLIVSGAADSLFPAEAVTVDQKLTLFAQTQAEVYGLRRRDGSLKVDPVDDRFRTLTPLQMFLLKKSVLPSWTENLGDYVAALDREDFEQRRGRAAWKMPRPFEDNYWAPVLKGAEMRTVMPDDEEADQSGEDLPPKFKFACVAYVSGVEWFWNNKAVKVAYEVDGERFSGAKWPRRFEDRETGEKRETKPVLPPDLVGSVAIITLSRWSAAKSFSIDDIVVVEKPFSLKVEEADEAEPAE